MVEKEQKITAVAKTVIAAAEDSKACRKGIITVKEEKTAIAVD